MKPKFEIIFLEQAIEFMSAIDVKAKLKIYFNLDKAKLVNAPRLFKKLSAETLVISTHGIIKKSSKVPQSDIARAATIRKEYFDEQAEKDETKE